MVKIVFSPPKIHDYDINYPKQWYDCKIILYNKGNVHYTKINLQNMNSVAMATNKFSLYQLKNFGTGKSQV